MGPCWRAVRFAAAGLCFALAWGCHSFVVLAEDVFYHVPLREVRFVEGPPKAGDVRWTGWQRQRARAMSPTAWLEGSGEIYLHYPVDTWTSPGQVRSCVLAVRVAHPREVTGWLTLPKDDLSGMIRLQFVLPPENGSTAEPVRKRFHEIMEEHYRRLLDRNAAGAGWFRSRFHHALLAQNKSPHAATTLWKSRRSLDDTFGLFTGGRAISENLRLNPDLRLDADAGGELVPLKSLPDIAVPSMDWATLSKGLDPEIDPLAPNIPHDQYGVFFPSFSDMLRVMDEWDELGTELLHFLEPRAEDRRIGPWYRRQLCIEVTPLDRMFGAKLIASVAMTGSDPYLRTGTDAAILFEAKDADALFAYFRAKQMKAKKSHPGVRDVRGKVSGVEYIGVRSRDRRICSYLFTIDKAVGVANSLVQLQRIVETVQGKRKAMSSLAEYKFFRQRYARSSDAAERETGFALLPDAAIRRLSGPQWRIGSSRRTRAAAIMAQFQAEMLDEMIAGEIDAGGLEYPRSVADLGSLTIHPTTVRSSSYGSAEFLTPIAELQIDRVTQSEAAAYRRWRRDIQRNWSGFFNSLAAQFSLKDEKILVDISVIPVIGGSDYQRLVQIAGDASLFGGAGDPHRGVMFHLVMAIDTKSKWMRNANELASLWLGIKDALGWIGGAAAVYVDDDPVWKQFLQASDPMKFWQQRGYQIPAAVHIDSSKNDKLQRVMAAAQRIDDFILGRKVPRETRRHNGMDYIKVLDNILSGNTKQAFFYAAGAKGFVLTLDEDTLKKSLDRQQAKQPGQAAAGKSPPRLGKHISLYATPLAVRLWQRFAGENNYRTVSQMRSWSNLPILNEWKRRYPKHDPVVLHRKFWNVTLTCPGGEYVWNERWQTMESTAFGHPGEPKHDMQRPSRLDALKSLNVGVDFEHKGVRVKAVIRRKAEQAR